MNMKIAIDVSQIIFKTGVSRYTQLLLQGLTHIDNKNNYVLFGGSLRRRREIDLAIKRIINSNTNFQSKTYLTPPTLLDLIWNKFHFLSIENFVGNVDVFHSSDWTQPPAKAFKVTTVHDLIAFKYPNLMHQNIVATMKRRLNWVKKEVDKIIVPSTSTKMDLVEYGFDEKKIIVIFEANYVNSANVNQVKIVQSKFGIKGNYLLAMGYTPYKNSKRIVEAFNKLKLSGYTLVIIGKKFHNFSNHSKIIQTGFVSTQQYSSLLTGAKALIFPSLYEGFGIGILDSFACHTPVVTSDVSSMPEIAGGAAVLVNPRSAKSIADGIEEVLKFTDKYVKKGTERIKNFSWEKTAMETLEVYQSAKTFKNIL